MTSIPRNERKLVSVRGGHRPPTRRSFRGCSSRGSIVAGSPPGIRRLRARLCQSSVATADATSFAMASTVIHCCRGAPPPRLRRHFSVQVHLVVHLLGVTCVSDKMNQALVGAQARHLPKKVAIEDAFQGDRGGRSFCITLLGRALGHTVPLHHTRHTAFAVDMTTGVTVDTHEACYKHVCRIHASNMSAESFLATNVTKQLYNKTEEKKGLRQSLQPILCRVYYQRDNEFIPPLQTKQGGSVVHVPQENEQKLVPRSF